MTWRYFFQTKLKQKIAFKGVSLISGMMATITAINALATTRFVMPCYLEPFYAASNSDANLSGVGQQYSATNCCGAFQNITTFLWEEMLGPNGTGTSRPFYCNAPDLSFYQWTSISSNCIMNHLCWTFILRTRSDT